MKNERTEGMLTLPLYEDEQDCYEFEAKVISCEKMSFTHKDSKQEAYALVLDRTAFFPEGGGQDSDEGFIDSQKVIYVEKKEGRILHYVEEPIEPGTCVNGKLDRELRFLRMQNHSGEHLVCGLIHSLHGFENVGFHMSEGFVTVDSDGFLSKEELAHIELLANKAIYENRPITVVYPENPDEMEFRSKLDLEEGVRVVIIDGYDACACCAPHVNTTGEIGIIKIVDSFSHRGGVRFIMKCGLTALEDYCMLHESNNALMRIFSAKREDVDGAAERFTEQLKGLKEQCSALKDTITGFYKEKLLAGDSTRKVQLLFTEGLDDIQMRGIVNDGVAALPGVVAVFNGNDETGYRYIVGKNKDYEDVNLKELAETMNAALSGRGGGSPMMIQGSISAGKNATEAFFHETL